MDEGKEVFPEGSNGRWADIPVGDPVSNASDYPIINFLSTDCSLLKLFRSGINSARGR